MNHRLDVAKWPKKGDAQLPRGADIVHFYFLACMHVHTHVQKKIWPQAVSELEKSKAFVGPILMHCNHETWVGLESLNIH